MSNTASGFNVCGHEGQWATPRRCQIPPNGLEIKPGKKHDASHDELRGTTARTNDPRRGDRVGYRKAQQVGQHGSHIDEVRRQRKQGGNPREAATALAGVITTGGQGGRHCLPTNPPPPPRDPPLHLTRRASSHQKAATSEVRYKSRNFAFHIYAIFCGASKLWHLCTYLVRACESVAVVDVSSGE